MPNDPALIKEYESEVDSPLTDGLTGLINHGFFIHSLAREIEKSARYEEPLTLALIDIDSFAGYNKRHGPLKGDRVLKEVANVVGNSIREVDLAARLSGDVFAVIYTKSDISLANASAERMRQAVEETFDKKPTVSIGLARFPDHAKNLENLLSKAEEALLNAKMKGRNNVFLIEQTSPETRSRPTVLVVDDDPTNVKLLEAKLFRFNYEILKAYSGEEALSIINDANVDLVLLDVMMPGIDGYEVCHRLKSAEDTKSIPVVMVTALDDPEAKVNAVKAGADDFLTKPSDKEELRDCIESLLRLRSFSEGLPTIEKDLMFVANRAEGKEEFTRGHVQRVTSMAVATGRSVGLSETEIDALRLGSILHDIGKVAISPDILKKPAALNDKEWEIMKSHPDLGYRICQPLAKNLGPALEIIRHHHERLDGSGYPDGLSGQEVSVPSQIMAVVDMYDAMTTNQPYRKALSKEKALDILRQEVEEGKLDKSIAEKFIHTVADGVAYVQ